ncbi:hypothetical protein HED60_18910 [Planctomycetales bacterium ZRK34]|nr:hypothetical protein HED60_18910 [Planctomycetales bacterium ZRK34]
MRSATILLLVLLALILLAPSHQAEAIVPHSSWGCAWCHVPHNAMDDQAVPLWAPYRDSTSLTDYYASPTMDATVGQVDGASKLCLSCHDGTQGYVYPSLVISDLAHSHPLSFVYDTALATADGELNDPSTLEPGVLDANSKMQCTSCHDVHVSYVARPYLRWPYENTVDDSGIPSLNNAAFCRKCHMK